MSAETKSPREQAEELYRKSQLMAEQDLDVYLGAKQRILDLLTIALTPPRPVPERMNTATEDELDAMAKQLGVSRGCLNGVRAAMAFSPPVEAIAIGELVTRLHEVVALSGWQLVPMAECGELADGDYVTRDEEETELNVKLLRNGRWYGANNLEAPTHILNPSFGPLPEVGR